MYEREGKKGREKVMMTNDLDYDEMPTMCQCQREKNEGKQRSTRGGWMDGGEGTVEYGLGKD